MGIEGNEKADREAVKVTTAPIQRNIRVYHRDINELLRKFILERWQIVWDSALANKLHKIKPLLKNWTSTFHQDRCQEVVLTRLRIGHVLITHKHLMERDQAPICEDCWTPLTVEHILIECPNYRLQRRTYFPQLQQIFHIMKYIISVFT